MSVAPNVMTSISCFRTYCLSTVVCMRMRSDKDRRQCSMPMCGSLHSCMLRHVRRLQMGCCDILATRDVCIVALICAGAVPLTRYPSFAAMRWREATMYRLQGEGGLGAIYRSARLCLHCCKDAYWVSSAARLRHLSASAGLGRTPCTPWRASTFASNVSASLIAAGAKPRSAARA